MPGPILRVTEGDLVRVHFTNNHTCHVVPHVTNDGAYPGGLLVPVITEAAAGRGAAAPHGHGPAPAPKR